jgi:uncharacterized protein
MIRMSVVARVARKILFFPLTRIIIAIVAVVCAFVLEAALFQQLGQRYGIRGQAWYAYLSGAVMIATVCLVYCGYVRIFERRAVTELAPGPALREFGMGAAIGFGLLSATIGCLWLAGCYHVEGVGRIPSATLLVAMGLLPGFFEEIIMRGIVFRISEESLGTWLALAISALLFGGLHLINPNATWFAALFIAVEAGILLGAAYIVTRRLWLPIGMHFAWNITQGAIFGVAVSGQAVNGLLRSTLSGPELLSGGAFGAEASVLCVLVCTSMALFLIVRAVRNGQIARPFWSRKHTDLITEIAGENATLDAQASLD